MRETKKKKSDGSLVVVCIVGAIFVFSSTVLENIYYIPIKVLLYYMLISLNYECLIHLFLFIIIVITISYVVVSIKTDNGLLEQIIIKCPLPTCAKNGSLRYDECPFGGDVR